jgi:hypothetical protein
MILNARIFESFIYFAADATGTHQHIKEVMKIIPSPTPDKVLQAAILPSYDCNGDTI